ncbi:hypothetical protein STAS_05715 [Striga asiatica]|uniref:Uncharacterized protein n=1 Tax=Striga asiatica TaxID=4170 RepID=A0A5A7PBE4_STRAF|nr:hypothetical protein STAS_05715 [Striga asiatica]
MVPKTSLPWANTRNSFRPIMEQFFADFDQVKGRINISEAMPSMSQRKIINKNEKGLEEAYKGVGIHSQLRKIKQELEKINRLETRPAVEISRQHGRSRSPLGLTEKSIHSYATS